MANTEQKAEIPGPRKNRLAVIEEGEVHRLTPEFKRKERMNKNGYPED